VAAVKARLLATALEDPYANLALEEALFVEMKQPVLRVWDSSKSVVIGRAQKAEFETDLAYCSSHSIPVVRRITGGGAVYHGPGNINWSFFVPRPEVARMDAKGVFTTFAGILVGALAGCGLDCIFVPPNSVADSRGKVSGMAAFISRGGVLCHGTVLLSANLEEAERLTRPKAVTIERKYTRSRFVPMSNCGVDRGAFLEQLAIASGYQLEADEPTEGERRTASRLLVKYRSDEWNLGDPFS
jgi:lipoate-protein ligase A